MPEQPLLFTYWFLLTGFYLLVFTFYYYFLPTFYLLVFTYWFLLTGFYFLLLLFTYFLLTYFLLVAQASSFLIHPPFPTQSVRLPLVTYPSLCSTCVTYRTLCHAIGHQVLPAQPLPREVEDFPRGDKHFKHVPPPTYLIYFSPRGYT